MSEHNSVEKVCGFLIVRKPHLNFDAQARGAFSSTPPKIDDIFYGGIDRMPWFDVDEDYYQGALPGDVKRARTDIKNGTSDFSGIEVCQDLSTTFLLLQHSNRDHFNNEIITLQSTKLAELKEIFPVKKTLFTGLGTMLS